MDNSLHVILCVLFNMELMCMKEIKYIAILSTAVLSDIYNPCNCRYIITTCFAPSIICLVFW